MADQPILATLVSFMRGLLSVAMARKNSYRSIIAVVILSAALLSFVQVNFVHASAAIRRVPNIPLNSFETARPGDCQSGSGRLGLIWFNNTANTISTYNQGYYSNIVTVNIGDNQSYADVYIRGSFFTCGNSSDESVWAMNIKPASTNGYRLYDLQDTTLYRGRANRSNSWSTKGSGVDAKLNLSGLADGKNNNYLPCGATYYCETFKIGLYRCFSSNGTSVTGDCSTDTETVIVMRQKSLNFSLTPNVTVNPNTVEDGSSFTVVPTVTKGGTTPSEAANVTLERIETQPGQSPTSTSTSSPPFAAVKDNGTYGVLNHLVTGYLEAVTTLPAGTRICFVLSVDPSANGGGVASTPNPPSPSACVVIGKRPKTQVWGGDLLVGGDTDTSISTKSGKTFGSWVEYAIFAVGTIKNTASGAAFAGQGIATNASSLFACDYSKLSFANTTSTASNYATANCSGIAGTIGHYSNVLSVPDVAARFPTNSSTPVVSGSDISSMSGVYTVNANLTISGGTIPKNKWVVINAPNRDVTITGNINYTNAVLHNLGDIPQVVIIAKNIIINSGVTNIDSWLIAKTGNIYTCETDPKTVSDCTNPLVVNGPVIANKLYLRRTAGSDKCNGSDCSPSGNPAETFNLRADAYLWGYGLSAGDGKIQTVHTTELPPRL